MMRQLFYSAFAHPFFEALQKSRDATLAAIAAKAVKEMAYHVRHSARMGDPARRRHRRKPSPRASRRVDDLWTYTGELFEIDAVERALDRGRHRARHGGVARAVRQDASMTVFAEAGIAASRREASCRAAAATGGIPSISASSSPNCNSCSALIRGRNGDRHAATDLAQTDVAGIAGARLGRRGVRGRSGNPGAVDRRSRRAARRPHGRRRGRSRHHADLFRLPGDEPDRAQCRNGADRCRLSACRGSRPCCRRPGPRTG